MEPYPSPPRAPPDLTPPGTPRGRYKIPPHLAGEKISTDLPVASPTDKKDDLLCPTQQKEGISVQQETSTIVQNILEEVARDLLVSQSSEPKHQTLEPERPDNSLIGSPVQGAARAPLANFTNFFRDFSKMQHFSKIFDFCC